MKYIVKKNSVAVVPQIGMTDEQRAHQAWLAEEKHYVENVKPKAMAAQAVMQEAAERLDALDRIQFRALHLAAKLRLKNGNMSEAVETAVDAARVFGDSLKALWTEIKTTRPR